MIRINEIKLSIDEDISVLPQRIRKALKIQEKDILSYTIYRESIDARKSDMIYFTYTVDVEVSDEKQLLSKHKWMKKTPDLEYNMPECGTDVMKERPIIIGFGPSGMFAALLLAQAGFCPVVYERGEKVEDRVKSVQEFWEKGILNEASNVQFGEGGAGTFSDGKLTTRVKDLRSRRVLQELVAFGAPKEILYQAHPHIGTDLLREVVKNIRLKIEALGGTIHFCSPVEDFKITDNKISSILVQNKWVDCDQVILCIGHSARDTFRKLHEKEVCMSAKAFAVGARIEHLQTFINEKQYKQFADHPKLQAAEYRFVHTANNGRGVYTFCMCPGGSVVASASQKDMLVINGMSMHARDSQNANSALLVQVTPADFGNQPLDGVIYQETLEKAAFVLGGSNYQAPAQMVEDYLDGNVKELSGLCKPSYSLGVKAADLNNIFSDEINEALKEGICSFDHKMPGFKQNAVLTGIETRSSSPVRISRHKETYLSENINNLYPCGEGAGYAGGIISAAIDGIKCAEQIIIKYGVK